MEQLLNEDQTLLHDSAVRLCADAGGPKRARALRDAGSGFDADGWRHVVAAGWPALLLPETAGGSGLGLHALALVLEQAGRQLFAVPLLQGAAAAWAMNAAADAGAHGEPVAPRVATGTKTGTAASVESDVDASSATVFASAAPTFAHPGAAASTAAGLTVPVLPDDGQPRGVVALSNGADTTLQGAACFVPFAAEAERFLVAARGDDGVLHLAAVPRTAAGLTTTATRGQIDGSVLGDLRFDGVAVAAPDLLASGPAAERLLAPLQALLLLGSAAELLGLAEAALAMTLGHLRLRHQFGKPLASFQALQHRAVDAMIDNELNRALVYRSAAAWDAGEGQWHPAMAAAAKARTSRSALAVTRMALQLHGAIGYTDEHDIGLYYKRAVALAARYGGDSHHATRFSQLTLQSTSQALQSTPRSTSQATLQSTLRSSLQPIPQATSPSTSQPTAEPTVPPTLAGKPAGSDADADADAGASPARVSP